MMKRVWFTSVSNQVQGPFSTEEIEHKLAQNTFANSDLIWCKRQSHWLPIFAWKTEAPKILATFEKVQVDTATWYLERDGQVSGPLNRNELLNQIKNTVDIDSLRIRFGADEVWQRAFDFGDLLVDLGLNKRIHRRVPFAGSAIVRANKKDIPVEITTISEGGIGILTDQNLAVGSEYSVTINSDLLSAPLHTVVQVRYHTGQSYGLQFKQINFESKSVILDYIRQLTDVSIKNPNQDEIDELFKQSKQPTWYIKDQKKQYGPFSLDETQKELKSRDDLDDLTLWTPGQKQWKSVYEFNAVLETLGLSRRLHMRAPIQGAFQYSQHGKADVSFNMFSISENGLGIEGETGSSPGEVIEGKIKSRFIGVDISVKAKVMHCERGTVGLEFLQITEENRALIRNYVAKFQPGAKAAA
ncbi:MAG: hypothetical protein COT74_06645 [Bdellovibrionales bacterium CG10_big_fil_rev_8_21_14_0_10_45_34]|nr:MAG: hypothetical protein COT74_06645 [Bdellovibrionales bacterium CG10_big_fil_rev_8_21_14_0_10_45_34]